MPSILESHSRRGSKQSDEMVSLLRHIKLEPSPEAEEEEEEEMTENSTVVPKEAARTTNAGFIISNAAAVNGIEAKAGSVEETDVEMKEIKKPAISIKGTKIGAT